VTALHVTAIRQSTGLLIGRHVDYLTALFQLQNFKTCIGEEAKMETASFHIRSNSLFSSGFQGGHSSDYIFCAVTPCDLVKIKVNFTL
jgi:hypothetical protein